MDKKRGVSLVLVMSIFVILGLLIITLMATSMSEIKISAAGADSKLAFHSAEAGLERGMSEIPGKCEAFPASPDTWVTMVNDAKYKSGLPDSLPAAPELVGTAYKVGFTIEEGSQFFDFRYNLTTSGKMNKSKRVVEAQMRCGPMGKGTTQY